LYNTEWKDDCGYRIGKNAEMRMAYFKLKSQHFAEGLRKALRNVILSGFWDE
jgi:hypothetical protein